VVILDWRDGVSGSNDGGNFRLGERPKARLRGRNATSRRLRCCAGGGSFPLNNGTEQRGGASVGLPYGPSAPLPRDFFEPDELPAALPQPNRAPQMGRRRVAEPPSGSQITLRCVAPRSSGCPKGMEHRSGDSFGLKNGTEHRSGGFVGLKKRLRRAVSGYLLG
jgi:hypothetical protein